SDLRADLSQENRRARLLEEDLELARAELEVAKRAAAFHDAVAGTWFEVGLKQELRFDESRLPAAQADRDRLQNQRDRSQKRVKDIIGAIEKHNTSKTQ